MCIKSFEDPFFSDPMFLLLLILNGISEAETREHGKMKLQIYKLQFYKV